MKKDAYQIITDKVIEKLNEGVIPWEKPWHTQGPARNLISKRPYRGINAFLLSCLDDHESPYWLTFKQCKDKGGHVKKGEKGFPVVFWKQITVNSEILDENDRPVKKLIPFLRYYTVFNVEQCEGIEVPPKEEIQENEFTPIEQCQQIIDGMPQKPEINFGGDRACYFPTLDYVKMPKPERFQEPEKYYNTLFHELTHATGHQERLNRKGISDVSFFGSHAYSQEELVAEMGAVFLCSETGAYSG